MESQAKKREIIEVEPTFIWNTREEGETEREWKYFELYREMGHRSLRELGEIEVDGQKTFFTQLGHWSTRWKWQERVREFDLYHQASEMAKIRDMYEKDKNAYIKGMWQTAEKLKRAIDSKLDHLSSVPVEEMPARELRQIALTWDIANRWSLALLTVNQPAITKDLQGSRSGPG